MPAPDGGDDLIGIGGPGEGPRVIIGLLQEAVDRGLEIDDRAERSASEATLGQLAEKPSTALSQEAEVGV